jgi:hypothetical protein
VPLMELQRHLPGNYMASFSCIRATRQINTTSPLKTKRIAENSQMVSDRLQLQRVGCDRALHGSSFSVRKSSLGAAKVFT